MVVETIAIAAIASGCLVLAGVHTAPVRAVVLVAIAGYAAWRSHGIGFRMPKVRMPTAHVVAIVAATLASFTILYGFGTSAPIRSPWSMVPDAFLALVAILTAATASAAYRDRSRTTTLGVAAMLALGSAVALLTYRVGFGFDHFIHAAAERIITTTGALVPTPLFYSAHYGLVTLVATLVPWAPIAWVDRLLVPTVALLLMPFVHRCLRAVHAPRAAALCTLALVSVPLLPLAVSTPQALANAFALATVFSVLADAPRTAVLIALAAAMSQPLTGIPTIALAVSALLARTRMRRARIPMLLLGALAVPAAFAIAAARSPALALHVAFAPVSTIARVVHALRNAVAYSAADFATADALTIVRVVLPLAWMALALIGARVCVRRAHPHALTLVAAPLVALVAAALVAATVTTTTQLGTEQSQFPMRLVVLAGILAAPLVAAALGDLAEHVRGTAQRAFVTMLLGGAAAFTLLLAYPRDDLQERSGLWSVSASDIAAVHRIADDAGDARYVVLANQMLGAAAIRELGFRPSYITCTNPAPQSAICDLKSEVLAFPLPAGGPVAAQFWELERMNPITRAPIDRAMSLVRTDRAYVVIHAYWRNAPRIAAQLTAIADTELPALPHLRMFRFDRAP